MLYKTAILHIVTASFLFRQHRRAVNKTIGEAARGEDRFIA